MIARVFCAVIAALALLVEEQIIAEIKESGSEESPRHVPAAS